MPPAKELGAAEFPRVFDLQRACLLLQHRGEEDEERLHGFLLLLLVVVRGHAGEQEIERGSLCDQCVACINRALEEEEMEKINAKCEIFLVRPINMMESGVKNPAKPSMGFWKRTKSRGSI
jgi:hypothetical protein